MKNARHSRRRNWAVMAAIAATGFLLWLGVLLALWATLNAVGIPTDFWPMAQTLTSTVTMVSILGGSILAVHQLSEAASNRHLAVADRLFEVRARDCTIPRTPPPPTDRFRWR